MADERLTLETPIAKATVAWRVRTLTLERGLQHDAEGEVVNDPTGSFIEVLLIGEDGERKQHRWRGADADAMIVALNKANLSTTSLTKRIFNRLIADGVIAGTVAGTPE